MNEPLAGLIGKSISLPLFRWEGGTQRRGFELGQALNFPRRGAFLMRNENAIRVNGIPWLLKPYSLGCCLYRLGEFSLEG